MARAPTPTFPDHPLVHPRSFPPCQTARRGRIDRSVPSVAPYTTPSHAIFARAAAPRGRSAVAGHLRASRPVTAPDTAAPRSPHAQPWRRNPAAPVPLAHRKAHVKPPVATVSRATNGVRLMRPRSVGRYVTRNEPTAIAARATKKVPQPMDGSAAGMELTCTTVVAVDASVAPASAPGPCRWSHHVRSERTGARRTSEGHVGRRPVV